MVFEHAIEQKTNNDQDELHFSEQFTAGEPQELVCSCAYMTSSKGYREAKQLLHKHCGDELQIGSAYTVKGLKWLQVKSDDGKTLNAYAMFLLNVATQDMEDIPMEYIEFVEEIPHNYGQWYQNCPKKWQNISVLKLSSSKNEEVGEQNLKIWWIS